MSDPFIGEIKVVSFDFPPRGWALCNGQLLPINQNQALFSLLGTTYGGNGQTNFALPDLRSRAPLHASSMYPQGAMVGAEQVTLTLGQLPALGLCAAATRPPPEPQRLPSERQRHRGGVRHGPFDRAAVSRGRRARGDARHQCGRAAGKGGGDRL